jgi:hypothetical protein
MPIGARWTITERERQLNNIIFRLLIHLFLSDTNLDTVDSQVVDSGPPQKLVDPLIFCYLPHCSLQYVATAKCLGCGLSSSLPTRHGTFTKSFGESMRPECTLPSEKANDEIRKGDMNLTEASNEARDVRLARADRCGKRADELTLTTRQSASLK